MVGIILDLSTAANVSGIFPTKKTQIKCYFQIVASLGPGNLLKGSPYIRMSDGFNMSELTW